MSREQGRHDVCRGKDCGRRIVWLRTSTNGWMRVDPANVVESDEYFDLRRHTAHFRTCPNATDPKKRGKP